MASQQEYVNYPISIDTAPSTITVHPITESAKYQRTRKLTDDERVTYAAKAAEANFPSDAEWWVVEFYYEQCNEWHIINAFWATSCA